MDQGWSELWFFVIGVQTWHWLWLFLLNFMMYLAYHFEIPWIEQYKINSDPWPWQVNREEWVKLMKRSILLIILNQVIGVSIMMVFDLWSSGFEVQLSFGTDDLPDGFRTFFTYIFLMICEDFAFHIFHRIAHWKYLYPHFHKYHHNYTTTVSLAGEHFHPVDFVFGALIPVQLGAKLLGKHLHVTTYFMWVVVRTMESVDAHSGYEFPWSPFRLIPFAASASYHDYHHTHQQGNFSSFFTFWDTIFGVNTWYYEYSKGLEQQ
jgi:sterol desaturase/sphingolipid hydroxylase (fatty acid hydroxylase superfamily)